MYATRQQVESRVPHELVVQALDDNRDGEIDPSVAVAAAREYRIDDVMAAPEQTSDPGVA